MTHFHLVNLRSTRVLRIEKLTNNMVKKRLGYLTENTQ